MPPVTPTHVVTSDASGSWGCRALTDQGQWFQVQWPASWAEVNNSAKEMVPVAISMAIWGRQWAKCQVLVKSDNMAVVQALTSGTARDPPTVDAHVAVPAFFHNHASNTHCRPSCARHP